jgi:hypothetical protein
MAMLVVPECDEMAVIGIVKFLVEEERVWMNR